MKKENALYNLDNEKKGKVPEALINKAQQANLPAFLISRGETLRQEGGRFRHQEHDSLVFTYHDNTGLWSYKWNSQSETGNAIRFVRSFYGLSFKEAVEQLASFEDASFILPPEKKFSFPQLSLADNCDKIIKYLSRERGIGLGVIEEAIGYGDLLQEKKTNNIIFLIRDQESRVVGAEKAGILKDNRFKGLAEGSKYGYGYSIHPKGEVEFALFFESGIDLLSFVDIKRRAGKPLTGCLLVSMAGLKENIIKQALEALDGPVEPVLCVDNDEAGEAFIESLTAQGRAFREHRPTAQYKDWNDQLRNGQNDK